MSSLSLDRAATLAALSPEWPDDPAPMMRQQLVARGRKLVVLDDDPTGTQAVYGIPVLTTWTPDDLRAELANADPACFILTNSRSLPTEEAETLGATIGRTLASVSQKLGRPLTVISRSDSTLRGHFPAEVDALAKGLGGSFDATLLIPAFFDGGRYTINDVHYVAQGERLYPASETAFARDTTFGYRNAYLPAWVAEKTDGRILAAAVHSISLDDIRQGGPGRVAECLAALPPSTICVVNAASERDLAVVAQAVCIAEDGGKRFMLRTAASFVAAYLGLPRRPLLTSADLNLPHGGGLIVVGSYVPSTTEQFHVLCAEHTAHIITLDTSALLNDNQRTVVIDQAASTIHTALERGEDVVVATSREVITGTSPAHSLALSRSVSTSLVALVQSLRVRPRYVLAKGGITSSDLATKGLSVRRAEVLGQILPGVPVWRLGAESRIPDLAYIVFPGNVGDRRALADVVRRLQDIDGREHSI